MTRPLRLELFDLPDDGQPADAPQIDELRLASFDQGYRSGWDDCRAAQTAEDNALRETLGSHLQALSFTYHEARSQVLQAVEPLLREMVKKVLPEVAHRALIPVLLERLLPLTTARTASPLVIRVAPGNHAAAAALLGPALATPFRLEDSETLGPGQAMLIFGDSDELLDLDGVTEAIAAALDSFFTPADPLPQTETEDAPSQQLA